jgi:hypothetical protein
VRSRWSKARAANAWYKYILYSTKTRDDRAFGIVAFSHCFAKAINPHHSFKARWKLAIASITLIFSILVSSIVGYVTSDRIEAINCYNSYD